MIGSNSVYRFPPNDRAKSTCLTDQVCYIEGELGEVKQAILLMEGDSRVIEELWDVIHAAEGALRKFPIVKVAWGLMYVIWKNALRGDYRGGIR